MTEQQREAFEAWKNRQHGEPIFPDDVWNEACKWQRAALSHAEGEAVGWMCVDENGVRDGEIVTHRSELDEDDWLPGFRAVPVYTHPAPAPEPESPRPMSAAPRDGSMIRLLVQFTNHGVNDGFDSGPAWTIGANTYDDSGDDEWHIAGWDWQQDCFTAGEGEPLGWLPMLSAPAPDEREIAARALESVAVELDTHLWRDAAIRVRGRAESIRSGTDAPSAIRRAVILRTGKEGDE